MMATFYAKTPLLAKYRPVLVFMNDIVHALGAHDAEIPSAKADDTEGIYDIISGQSTTWR